jgi:hypothetical protein
VDRLQLSLFSISFLDYPKLSLIIYIRKQHNGLPFWHSAERLNKVVYSNWLQQLWRVWPIILCPKVKTRRMGMPLGRVWLIATLCRMKEPQESEDEGSQQDQKRRNITKTRQMSTMNEKAENKKFAGELDTTEKGLLRFKSDCWQKMDEKEKEFVREYNASVEHGDPLDKLIVPDGIRIKNRPRRTLIKQEADTDQSDQQARVKMSMRPHKKKGITFGICPEDGVEYVVEI